MSAVRSLVVVGLFEAVWGAMELSLGALLHALRVPFSGMFLAAAGIAVALAGHRFVPKPGTIFEIGLVTAALKAASLGGVLLSPMIGGTLDGTQGLDAAARTHRRPSRYGHRPCHGRAGSAGVAHRLNPAVEVSTDSMGACV